MSELIRLNTTFHNPLFILCFTYTEGVHAMRRSATLTTRELMAARFLIAVVVALLALPLAPALAGCPPDERPCGGTTGTTTTAPSAPTAVPQPEPTPDNVMINVPAPTSPPSTQPSSCYDFPAPSFSLPHDGAGRLITQGMLWETVRDTLPGQSEWVEYHTDWPNFGDPCSTLYGKGVQDKTDLESFLAYLNSLAAQSNQSNNQEEPTAQPTSAPAPTAAPPVNQGQKGPSAQQCQEWRNKLAEARNSLAAANAAVDQAQSAHNDALTVEQQASAERERTRGELEKAKADLATAQDKLRIAKGKLASATDDKSERGALSDIAEAEAEVQEAEASIGYWQTKFDEAGIAFDAAQRDEDTKYQLLMAAQQRQRNAQRAVDLLEMNLRLCPDTPDPGAA